MAGTQRLSQRISEDGIALIVRVADAAAAGTAEEEGAKAVAVDTDIPGIREATSLPVVWTGGTDDVPVEVDAVLVHMHDRPEEFAPPAGLELVVCVHDEDDLEEALEQMDPDLLVLAPKDADDGPHDGALELLPDVPAGKLVIADSDPATRDEIVALERAGFDAVIVAAGSITELIGDHVPDDPA